MMHLPSGSSLGERLRLSEMRVGSLDVRVANREEIERAQELRYRVFVEEMGGTANGARKDEDAFDALCDHLVVVDQASAGVKVVGCYRLLRRGMIPGNGKFYTEREFDISAIRRCAGEILEVGRSCVDSEYRNRAVMRLLWRAIGAYIASFDVRLLFGCASFPGVDSDAHAKSLSYLHHYCLAAPELRPIALAHRRVEMNRMSKEAIEAKTAFAKLPTLVKGYLRLNGQVGLGAVVDFASNTTDVCVVVDAGRVARKYTRSLGGWR